MTEGTKKATLQSKIGRIRKKWAKTPIPYTTTVLDHRMETPMHYLECLSQTGKLKMTHLKMIEDGHLLTIESTDTTGMQAQQKQEDWISVQDDDEVIFEVKTWFTTNKTIMANHR